VYFRQILGNRARNVASRERGLWGPSAQRCSKAGSKAARRREFAMDLHWTLTFPTSVYRQQPEVPISHNHHRGRAKNESEGRTSEQVGKKGRPIAGALCQGVTHRKVGKADYWEAGRARPTIPNGGGGRDALKKRQEDRVPWGRMGPEAAFGVNRSIKRPNLGRSWGKRLGFRSGN